MRANGERCANNNLARPGLVPAQRLNYMRTIDKFVCCLNYPPHHRLPRNATPATARCATRAGDPPKGGADPGANNDDVDFSKISIKEALELLGVEQHGLTEEAAAKRLNEYGPNKLPETTINPFIRCARDAHAPCITALILRLQLAQAWIRD
jgi:magnesium-transporting ATPase (P-type)